MNRQPPVTPTDQPQKTDPRRNLFWMFISFMGVSTPREGQERRAIAFLLIGVLVILMFVAAGILALFRFW